MAVYSAVLWDIVLCIGLIVVEIWNMVHCVCITAWKCQMSWSDVIVRARCQVRVRCQDQMSGPDAKIKCHGQDQMSGSYDRTRCQGQMSGLDVRTKCQGQMSGPDVIRHPGPIEAMGPPGQCPISAQMASKQRSMVRQEKFLPARFRY